MAWHSKISPELFNNVIAYVVADSDQDFSNGFSYDAIRGTLLESYFARHIRPHLHFRVCHTFDELEPGEYCAILSFWSSNKIKLQIKPFQMLNANSTAGNGYFAKKENPMLIETRQLIDPEKRVGLFRADSMIGLQRLNLCNMGNGCSRRELSSIPVITITVDGDGKLCSSRGSTIIEENKIPHQMV